MSKRPLSFLIASLFTASPALAQQSSDPFLSTGQVSAGGIVTDTANSKDLSKFEEYRDLSNGTLSTLGILGRNSQSWINFYGENFGRQDMYIDARGGMYDVFKARAYTNWIPHNLLFNGLTPFVGSGGPNLIATFPNPDPTSWQNLNLGYERKDTGGYFEWQQQSPWYFRVDGNQVKFNGTKLGSGPNGTSPGNGFSDLPLPIQYETNNAAFEMGYTTKMMTVTGSYMVSNFGNKFETVNWTNPFFGSNIDHTYLPPDNNYQRLALNATWRALPLASTLALRCTWDQTTSDVNVGQSVLNAASGTIYLPTQPSSNTFNGDEKRQTFTAGWSATPVTNVDTRLYYNWQKMNNDGTEVTFCMSSPNCNASFQNELFHYQKNNAGADAWWRATQANRIGFGYDWFSQKQNRPDFDKETTNTVWAEWKNTSLDTVIARIKYSYLQRNSTFLLANAGANANDPAYLERFVRAFDLTNVKQNRVKVRVDWTPSETVSTGFEYLFKNNDYSDTTLGRQNDKRNEFFANLTYGTPDTWRTTLFADYEDIHYNSYHRNVNAGTCPTTSGGVTANDCFDPSTPPNSIAYNWGATVKNINWMAGVGLDYPVNDKLMFTGSFLYEETDGSSDMSAQNNYGNPLPLPNYPNIKITSLNLKGTYKFSKNWSLNGGYAYQKYNYSDDAFNGYTYTIPFPLGTSTSPSYLSGWNAFQSYNANIFWLTLKFTWDPPVLQPPPLNTAVAAPTPAARPVPPPPTVVAAPAPAPPPGPAKVQKIMLDAKVLFDFDKAVLKPQGKAAIDSQVVGKLSQLQKLEVVLVTGHTDPIGSDKYNQQLSERRADAVRNYLATKGIPKDKIEAIGMGEKQPVAGLSCTQKSLKERIACFAPDRRVEVEAKGDSAM